MKLLKEIGQIEEIQGISFKQKLIVLTEQERRELVCGVIRKWEAYKWQSLERESVTRQTYSIEEFLESEGL